MLSSPYFTRIAAATSAALLLAFVLANARVLTAPPKLKSMPPSAFAAKECAIGEAVLSTGFAAVDQVLSVAPVGPPRLKGERDPAPLLRIIGLDGAPVDARAPAKGEIVAVSRSTIRSEGKSETAWSVAMIPCADHLVTYGGLASLDRKILRRLGPLTDADFSKETRIKVSAGQRIGGAESFDIGLYASQGLTAAKRKGGTERYLSAPADAARCPIEHLKRADAPHWKALFGDAKGAKLPAIESACATSKLADPVAAQGLWLTDASHGARTNKVVNTALTADVADPDRLVFSFFGRLPSLQASMFDAADEAARADAAHAYLTAKRGRERINAPFSEIVPNSAYCYQDIRAGLSGPALKGVIILKLSANGAGAPILKAEAIPNAKNCENLREPWSFTGAETAFFRENAAAN